MRYAVYAVLIIFGLRYGVTYLESEDFQKYADESKAPWTCRVNLILGKFNMTMSRYDDAIRWFSPIAKRCEKTTMSEEAAFQTAVSLEQLGRRAEALEAYRKYAEAYKGSARARIAIKAADFLTGG